MAFSFAVQPQDYALRAQAGLSLDPSMGDPALAAQAQQAAAAPPAQMQPQGQPQGQPQAPLPDIKVSPAEAIMSWLAHGGTPGEAAQSVRAVKRQNVDDAYALQKNQMLMDALRSASPEARQAMLFNSPEYGKALSSHFQNTTLSGGQTLVNGPTSAPYTAPIYGVTDHGVGYSVGPGGLQQLGVQLPGGKTLSAESGAVVDSNLGLTGQKVGVFHTTPLGSRLSEDLGSLGTSAGPGGPPAAQGAPQSSGLPRGLRNLNPGNLMALPSGHMWDGQTGVDSSGYAVFGTPEAGVKAAQTNLNSYAKLHGLNTVAGVVSRWAPHDGGNDTASYTKFVAQQMGVDPNQPLDMTNPHVQQAMLSGIFQFENGPKAMAGWQGQAQPTVAPQSAASAAPGETSRTILPAKAPRPLTDPAERAANGIDPNDRSPYVLGPNGIEKRGENLFGPAQQLEYTKTVTAMDPYKNYTLGRGYLSAMQGLMKQPGGFADLSLIENAGKTINPTVAIRPNMIEQYGKETGWPDWLVGEVSSVVNHGGHLTQEGRNALLNIAQTNVKSHWDQLQPILKKVDHDAAKYGATRGDLIPDLIPLPEDAPPSYPGAKIPHSAGQGGAGAAPVAVNSPAEAMRLPPGTAIRLPDGRIGKVPAR